MKAWHIAAAVGGVGLLGLAIVAARRGSTTPDDGHDHGGDEGDDMINQGKFENTEKPIAVGEATDPKVAPLVAEAQALWDSLGVPRHGIDVVRFWTMSKAPLDDGPDEDDVATRPIAVPPRATWERSGVFLRDVVVPILRDYERRGGKLSELRFGGYRPADYNAAVSGAPKSRHVDGDGIDIIPTKNVTANADRIIMAIARFKVDHPNDPIGFGAYAANGHVDIGGRRNWSGDSVPGKAEKYLARAEQETRIA